MSFLQDGPCPAAAPRRLVALLMAFVCSLPRTVSPGENFQWCFRERDGIIYGLSNIHTSTPIILINIASGEDCGHCRSGTFGNLLENRSALCDAKVRSQCASGKFSVTFLLLQCLLSLQVAIPQQDRLLHELLALSCSCDCPFTATAAAKCFAGLINKYPEGNK